MKLYTPPEEGRPAVSEEGMTYCACCGVAIHVSQINEPTHLPPPHDSYLEAFRLQNGVPVCSSICEGIYIFRHPHKLAA